MLNLSRKLLAACLLFAGMATVGFAQTSAASQPVTSQEGHFHIVFPGEPKATSDNGIQSLAYVPENSGLAYIVVFKEIPADMLAALNAAGLSDDDRLAAFTKGCIEGMDAKVTAERATNSSGVVGKEVYFEMANGASGVARCYIAGGRLYQVVVVWRGVAPAASDVSEFLDSFVLDS